MIGLTLFSAPRQKLVKQVESSAACDDLIDFWDLQTNPDRVVTSPTEELGDLISASTTVSTFSAISTISTNSTVSTSTVFTFTVSNSKRIIELGTFPRSTRSKSTAQRTGRARKRQRIEDDDNEDEDEEGQRAINQDAEIEEEPDSADEIDEILARNQPLEIQSRARASLSSHFLSGIAKPETLLYGSEHLTKLAQTWRAALYEVLRFLAAAKRRTITGELV